MIVFQLRRKRIRDSSECCSSSLFMAEGVCAFACFQQFSEFFHQYTISIAFIVRQSSASPPFLKKERKAKITALQAHRLRGGNVCQVAQSLCLGHRLSLFLNCNQALKASSLPPGHSLLFWGVSRVIGVSLPVVICPLCRGMAHCIFPNCDLSLKGGILAAAHAKNSCFRSCQAWASPHEPCTISGSWKPFLELSFQLHKSR